jgi:hypothetical protein
MKRKSEKQLIRETNKHTSRVKKFRKIASLETEKTLLTATHTYRVHGQLLIQPRVVAISKAIGLSIYQNDQMVYFTDGAVSIPSKESRRHTLGKRRPEVKLANAIAHRASECSTGRSVTFFSLRQGQGRGQYYLQAEIAGIAGALGLATSRLITLKRERSDVVSRVIISTGCQAAIYHLQKLQEVTEEQAQCHTLAHKLISRSQYRHSLNVSLETYWTPCHHEEITGNTYAEPEARRRAKSLIPVYEEEDVQIII